MDAKGAVLAFRLAEGESLMSLVAECGYSKPTKEDPVARRTIPGFGAGKAPVIEVHRKSKDWVYLTVLPGAYEAHLPYIILEAWADLQRAGL